MSQNDEKGAERPDGDIDLDFEWDDALADWEDEIEETAEARSAPMPQTSGGATPPAPPRPLYRPPSPDEQFAQRKPISRPRPVDVRADFPALIDDDEEDEVAESTRIASIPQELINSLVGRDERGNEHPTRPPPALRQPVSEMPNPPAVDLDLDGLLDGMEQETRDVHVAVPDSAARSQPPVGGAAEASPDAEPVSGARSRPPAGGAAEVSPDETGDQDVAESVPPREAEPAPALPVPPPPKPPAEAVAAPPAPPRRLVVPPPRPPSGAKPAVPRPALPPIPRPGQAKPMIPKPGAPRAAVPRPPLPAIPRPQAKAPPKPAEIELDEEIALEPEAQEIDSATASDEALDALLGLDSPAEALDAPKSDRAPAPDDATSTADAPALYEDEAPAPDRASDEPAEALALDDAEPAPALSDDEAPAPDRASDEPAEALALDDAEPTSAPADDAEPSTAPAEEPASALDEEADLGLALPDDEPTPEPAAEAGEAEPAADAASEPTPEPALEEEDDGELAFESAEDEDDEDWEALEAAQDAAEAERIAQDRGALAARRSVRSRKPRDEVFPMVGEGPDALRLRQRLLETLAKSREGGVRARLLASAAELAEQLGDADGARTLYQGALEADPSDVVSLRALRRDALVRGAWDELATHFAKEAELALSPNERALAHAGLAEVQLSRRGDPKAAEEAAAKALELAPASLSARLLLTEARIAQGRAADAIEALAPAAEAWDDPRAKAAVHVQVARHAEREGRTDDARERYRAACELDEGALDARFGLARTAADPNATVAALSDAASQLSGPLAEALRTRASRVATLTLGDAEAGLALLDGATGVLALQARAEAAAATGDPERMRDALAAWASAAGGTDRALALVRMAEALAAEGDLDAAEAALRDAALADGSLGTIRVVREVIARRAGDLSRLVEAIEGGGALSTAARLVPSGAGGETLARERDLLQAAESEGHALVSVDVLALDVAAAQDDPEALDAALRRQADRVPPEHRLGSLLALAERAIERADLDTAEAVLSEARSQAPGDPLVLRPLGRLSMRRDAKATAAMWMEESSVGAGERAAYAATEAGRVLERADGDAVGALRRALDASRGYGPAAALLLPLATDLGDPLTLLEVHEQLADVAASPTDAAGHLVRAALLRAHDEPDSAGALLERGREAAPADAVLQSLLMRLSGTATAAERGAMLAASAESAPPLLARVLRLQAAAAFEDAGDHAAAAACYREVQEHDPDDPIVEIGLDRAEIAADEIARVAERRFQAVKDAGDDERRILALERLAELDLHERKDPASAVLSRKAILETAPGHLPSLRALQRHFAEQKRTEDHADVLERMAAHLDEGPDVTAHLRLARRLRLAPAEASGEAADALLVEHAERAELDLWLAPRVLAAADAQEAQAVAATAARRLAEQLASADERASARVRAAERTEDAEAALELLREAVQSSPLHPSASTALAEACERAERWEEAAEAWESAARSNEVRARAAACFYRAGRLFEERLEDAERARSAYEHAAERDVTHGDLFDRLAGLLGAPEDRERLAELYGQRLAAGGDAPVLVELYVKQAKLHAELRDLSSAKAALRAALALTPERLDALRMLANLCLEDEDWRGAAEVLIRIARIRKEREELRWVFFTLGDIYDRHLPDPRRAEAAFQRVLKLLPEDIPAMERLAALFEREGQHAKAAETLVELARLDVDPEQGRAHRLKLAAMYEQMDDARRAEQVLEEARKNAPTDLAVLRGLADFYRRQDASNALSMHLGRAVNDFRHALDADLGDAAAWPGLVEVLTWRGDRDAASVAASAAQALGIVDVETSKLVDARGAAPGLLAGAARETLDELLAPPQLPAPTREVFKLAGDALEKSLPFDVAAYRAEKLNPRDTSIRPIALEVARALGVDEPQLYVTSAAPRVCVPVYSNPATLLIGSELLGITDDREKLFVLVRAFKIAQAQLSVVVRAQPAELLALLGGLVSIYDPRHALPGADPTHVGEAARRIGKTVQRKAQGELGPLVFEMAGRPGYDPTRFAMAASEWGNRTALVASGSVPAGISALAKLSGERELPTEPAARLAMLQRFPEAASLLTFAISDTHFEARKRAGQR